MLNSLSKLLWILPHQITPESTWAEELHSFPPIHLNSLTAVKCLLRPGVLTQSAHTPIPINLCDAAFIQFTMTELQTGHNMTHISSTEHGHQLCAWASLAQTGSYLQRSTGCLLTLDKASLPWERLDSPTQRLSRGNSAPLWRLGHITTTQPSVVGSRIYFGTVSFIISCNSVAWSNFWLFLRLHIFPYACHSYLLSAGERN